MYTIEEKDRVTFSFTGKLDNGTIFSHKTKDDPMTITIGEGELPPSVEIALKGLQEGASKTIRIPPEEGYGPRMKELIHELPLSAFGKKITPTPGMVLSQKMTREGTVHEIPATIVSVEDDKVTIDYNHPLAGHHLTYEIGIITIEK